MVGAVTGGGGDVTGFLDRVGPSMHACPAEEGAPRGSRGAGPQRGSRTGKPSPAKERWPARRMYSVCRPAIPRSACWVRRPFLRSSSSSIVIPQQRGRSCNATSASFVIARLVQQTPAVVQSRGRREGRWKLRPLFFFSLFSLSALYLFQLYGLTLSLPAVLSPCCNAFHL